MTTFELILLLVTIPLWAPVVLLFAAILGGCFVVAIATVVRALGRWS